MGCFGSYLERSNFGYVPNARWDGASEDTLYNVQFTGSPPGFPTNTVSTVLRHEARSLLPRQSLSSAGPQFTNPRGAPASLDTRTIFFWLWIIPHLKVDKMTVIFSGNAVPIEMVWGRISLNVPWFSSGRLFNHEDFFLVLEFQLVIDL